MKKAIVTALTCLLATTFCYAQNLSQTVRGTIRDIDNNSPLIGASVVIVGSDPIVGTTTDIDGKFRLINVPTGRITLQLSYIGYEARTIPNIVVNSGKEVVLEFSLQESAISMKEAVVTAHREKGKVINEMALISARSISAEETNRYAGGFNDPSRIVSNFAGVGNSLDGGNDIIIRGNSPKYMQWRLEGIQITNPNHFADQSALSGSISTLNNNLLSTSDFYTGAFTAEYGDVLSGIYDVKMRAGNNEKFEAAIGVGLLGTDVTIEGPFKKGYGGSYLVNYRYSTASMISDLGLVDINGVPKFQDAAFKVVLPAKKAGTFSIFGLAGLSSFSFEDVQPQVWKTPGNSSMKTDIKEDYDKQAHLMNTGINHTINLGKQSFLKTTLSYSNEGINDDIYQFQTIKIYNPTGEFSHDSIAPKRKSLKGRLTKSTYRAAVTYHHKLNAKNKIQVGSKYALFHYQNNQLTLNNKTNEMDNKVNFNENIGTVRNFISWKYRLNKNITFVTGLHNMNVLLNSKSTLEPRVALNWKIDNACSFHVGYGHHSTMESVHNYFVQIEQPDGSLTSPNKDLDLLKAHHYVIGVEKRLNNNLTLKAEAYYQDLYNLPVENDPNSYFATINEDLDTRYADLVNKGTGKNYGLELTIEKSFDNKFYYLINGSVFDSKYTALDGKERNTKYNGQYMFNLLFGKEFYNLGKKRNRTLSLNAKVMFAGGKKIIPLLRDNQGNLAVDPENNQFWDYDKAYEKKIEDIYMVTLSASYKFNKPKATHEIFINLDNLTNTKGKLSEHYDEKEPNSVGYVTQFGLFPNLMYRVYF